MVILDRTPAAATAPPYSPLQRSSPRVPRESASPPYDPILPYVRSISKAMDELGTGQQYDAAALDQLKVYITECIEKYGDDYQYSTDPRLLKIWILYADATGDFPTVYKQLEERTLFLDHALLYEAYALFLFAKGQVLEADKVYGIGISRKAEPLDHLKKMHLAFLKHLEKIVEEADADAQPKPSKIQKKEPSVVDPWSQSTRNTLLETINGGLKKFAGFHRSNKVYSGKVPLTSSLNVIRNKVIELGGRKYLIKGSPGTGAFAKVYKATVDGNTEELVALKIQKPSFPWEFYMYRLLDMRISNIERPSFGYTHEVHVFSDISVLICDYLPYGTLLDAINYHFLLSRNMDEILCMYYTIEMLNMLETLHSVGIIHGDFKPDNILVCYPREITEDTFRSETRAEQNQGLCLVDWGRGIDLNLFPTGTEFHGDCGTSGFSCVEMQEERTWTYQADTYGLCAIAHMMLHGTPMSVEKAPRAGGGYEYQPKLPFKRYWNVELWKDLFSTLLNAPSNGSDVAALRSLRASFREYMCSNRQHIGKLNQQLAKQKASLCSS
ncbi:mitotic checkpoint serine/threonine-protein kinase BUB1-like isoform X2 [Phragmites australis]|uniref:mitotic checkpoint serine/threonine-protein kinase BUB1-like isoform X2 n=1 Tax=Phragmites australis TaxID=29695 RepID=UPI002D76EAE4|nr:mitotic checkpoint serine/threonine-protein kinase BUB1-like isoform X2 [Phragmites australis]